MAGMNPKYKASWVKALRSGKFKQGSLRLHRNDTYCCLGVLCVIAGLPKDRQYCDGSWEYNGSVTSLSLNLTQEFGLTGLTSHLIGMNDDDGKTFAEIADYIEEKL